MANPEIALLQFVALALPAVAILLQAIQTFQSQHGDLSGIESFEIRFIELGFFALAGAGVLFAIEIFFNNESWVIKVGIATISVSFLLLALATAFGLRRPIYQAKRDITLEQAILRDVRRISPIILIIVVGSLLIYSSILFVRDTNFGSLIQQVSAIIEQPTSILSELGIIVVILTIVYSMVGLRSYYGIRERNRLV